MNQNGPTQPDFLNSLSVRAIFAMSVLIMVISIVLTIYFTLNQKNMLAEELNNRCTALADNLAYNAEYSVLFRFTDQIQPLINGVLQEEDIVYAYIVDKGGVIIGHNDTSLINTILDKEEYQPYLKEHKRSGSDFTGDGTDQIIRISSPVYSIESSDIVSEENLFRDNLDSGNESNNNRNIIGVVFLGVSTKNFNESIEDVRYTAILISFVLAFLGIVITILMITRFVTHPIRNLMGATERIAGGDLDHTVPIGRKDEIGILSDSFNKMTQRLKLSRQRVEGWNRILESRVIDRTKELSKKNLELKKNSEDLQKAIEELKTLDKSKDDFLSLVSHELRTPLSSIVAYTEVLLDDFAESKEDEKKYLGIIKNESGRLTRLINDVLDLSKMEAGRMPFDMQPVNIGPLVESCVAGLSGLANKHSHTIINELIDQNIIVMVDADKIQQVLTNIISNAIKFSEDGKMITVTGRKENGNFTVSVVDKGIGIRPEDHDKVFDKFQQIEDVHHHSEGTGLGMPISRIIIENHNGKIWFDSELGKGTTFHFTLPIRQVKEEASE